MNHRSPPYATLVAAILLCLRAATVAGGELGLASVTQGPADLTIPADVPAGEAQRYGLGFPFQVGPTTAALWVNLRQEGTGVGDFENGSDVVLFSDLAAISGVAAVRLTRNEKWTTPAGEKRILLKFPDVGGFVPLGARRADGSPHPYAGTGFSFCEALEFPMTADGKFSWDAASLRLVEIHQVAFTGQAFRLLSTDLRRPDRPMMLGDSDWHLAAPGLAAAIPDGDDLLQAVQVRHKGRGWTACGVVRWQALSGAWQPISYSEVTVGCSEPTLIRDRDGALLFTARTYGDDFNAVRVWRSGDGGASWTTAARVPQIREPVPLSLNQALDGTPYIATNPLGQARSVLLLWPLDMERANLEAPLLAQQPRKGLSQSVDHPTGATVRLADGKWHHVLVYRMRLGGDDETGARRVGCCVEEVLARGSALPTWQFAEP
jgi:hypothetical protein